MMFPRLDRGYGPVICYLLNVVVISEINGIMFIRAPNSGRKLLLTCIVAGVMVRCTGELPSVF